MSPLLSKFLVAIHGPSIVGKFGKTKLNAITDHAWKIPQLHDSKSILYKLLEDYDLPADITDPRLPSARINAATRAFGPAARNWYSTSTRISAATRVVDPVV